VPTAADPLTHAEAARQLRPDLAALYAAADPPARPAPKIEVTPELMRWASGIAVAVAKGHRLVGQERDEIRATAYFELVRHANAWNTEAANLTTGDAADVAGAFKGYAARGIRFGCLHEAVRLRAGGTVGVQWRGRDGAGNRLPPVFADPLSCLSTPAGDPFDVPDRADDDDGDDCRTAGPVYATDPG
jgi:hypothetical protein